MRAIGQMVTSQTDERFNAQIDPGGKAWKPSSRAEEQGGETLRDTGRLKNSIHYQVVPGGVVVGTNVVYGPPHQFGVDKVVTVKSHARGSATVGSHSRHMKIEKRPFLGINTENAAEIRVLCLSIIGRMAGVGV